MEFDVSADCLVKGSYVESAEKIIAQKLLLDKAIINLHMPSESFSEEYFGTIVYETKKSIAASNGFFKDSSASFDGRTLKIHLAHGGLEVLKTCECDSFIANLVLRRFKRQIDVVFCGEEVTPEDERVISMIKQAEADIPQSVVKDIQKKAASHSGSESGSSKPKKHEVIEGVPVYFETAKPIYGNKVSKSPTPIAEISPEDGSCTVWGDVFSLETRETRDGRSVIITFNITDGTYSYSCKIFLKQKQSGKWKLN